jgi:sarcosine oxidase subunit delta
MQIACPYCGARDAQEFAYLGDATLKRPDPSAADVQNAFHDYVYLRDNPAGAHQEFWIHSAGCRRWLRVSRHMTTHKITATQFACDAEVAS